MEYFGIEDAKEKHASTIVNLFMDNYQGSYHYEVFLSVSKLRKLIADHNFAGWVATLPSGEGIGFCGAYLEKHENIRIVKLAHLLTDHRHRALGVGSSLENHRSKFCASIPGPTITIASCVDDPIYSIRLKEKKGFKIWGTRLFYRPREKKVQGNSIVMGLMKDVTSEVNNIGSTTNFVTDSSYQ